MNSGSAIDPVVLQQLSNEFDAICMERHLMGAEKYGEGTYLGVDTLQMALEEIADLANYARYTFIKIRLMQENFNIDSSTVQPVPKPRSGFFSYRKDQK